MSATIFDGYRMTLSEAIDQTAASILAYGPRYEYWSMAYSGGKDSTTTITLADCCGPSRSVRMVRAMCADVT